MVAVDSDANLDALVLNSSCYNGDSGFLQYVYSHESFGINFLRMQLQQLARWPDFVYRLWARRILTFGLPVILVGSAPVHWLLSPFEFKFMAYMFLAIIVMWLIIAPVWRLSLSRYENASS